MSRFVLDVEYDFEFDLIAICSNSKDYSLVWHLNRTLQIHMQRDLEDFSILLGKTSSTHAVFRFTCEETHASYELIKNKGTGGLLIPEQAQVQYFLLLYDNGLQTPDHVASTIKQINVVSLAFVMNVESLVNKENLITA